MCAALQAWELAGRVLPLGVVDVPSASLRKPQKGWTHQAPPLTWIPCPFQPILSASFLHFSSVARLQSWQIEQMAPSAVMC
jgi:hypothetical protein